MLSAMKIRLLYLICSETSWKINGSTFLAVVFNTRMFFGYLSTGICCRLLRTGTPQLHNAEWLITVTGTSLCGGAGCNCSYHTLSRGSLENYAKSFLFVLPSRITPIATTKTMTTTATAMTMTGHSSESSRINRGKTMTLP